MIREIHSLLSYEIKDGNLISSGPMSPFTAAQEITKELGIKFDHLARVWYEDSRMLQINDGGSPSGYDHLIAVYPHSNVIQFAYFIDMGTEYMPIALYFDDNEDELTISPYYLNFKFILKPTEEELIDMFKSMVEHEEYYMSYNYKELKESRVKESHVNGK